MLDHVQFFHPPFLLVAPVLWKRAHFTEQKRNLIKSVCPFSHGPQCFVGMEIREFGGWWGFIITLCCSAFLSGHGSLSDADMRDDTLGDLLLQMQTCGMIRWQIFSCRCRHSGWYAGRSSLADADMRDDTLADLLLQMQTCGMIRWEIFSCRCRHTGLYAGRSSLADADMRDDTLGDLLLQMQTCGMIRGQIFSCRCRHAGW